jgi:tetratricopeptide (TPR) repeat protein
MPCTRKNRGVGASKAALLRPKALTADGRTGLLPMTKAEEEAKMRRRFLTVGFPGLLFLLSSLTASAAFQDLRIEISPDQERYLFSGENPPPVFQISAPPKCVVGVEVANDNRLFLEGTGRNDNNFFSSLFGSEQVEAVQIVTDEAGHAEYPLNFNPWNLITGKSTKLYYRAFIVDVESSDIEKKQLAILGTSLEDDAWQDAPFLEVSSSPEKGEESDLLSEAKIPFQNALDLYEQEKYEEALEMFQRANEITSRGNIDYMISLCYLQLARISAEKALEHSTSSDLAKRVSKLIIKAVGEIMDIPPDK